MRETWLLKIKTCERSSAKSTDGKQKSQQGAAGLYWQSWLFPERPTFSSGLDVDLWFLQVWTELRPGLGWTQVGHSSTGGGTVRQSHANTPHPHPPPPAGSGSACSHHRQEHQTFNIQKSKSQSFCPPCWSSCRSRQTEVVHTPPFTAASRLQGWA